MIDRDQLTEALDWCMTHHNKMATADMCFSGLYYGALAGTCQRRKAIILLDFPTDEQRRAARSYIVTHWQDEYTPDAFTKFADGVLEAVRDTMIGTTDD